MNRGPSRPPRDGEPALPLVPMLTSQEVAAILRVPVRTLDHFAYMRTGPRFSKIGKHRRYHPDDVRSWITSQCAG